MTPLAVNNIDVLRRIADRSTLFPTIAALAAHFGRDKDNFGKTLKKLTAEGMIERRQSAAQGDCGLWITPAGQHVIRAMDTRDGMAADAAPDAPAGAGLLRIPHADLVPNPANPRKAFDADRLAALAATIEADGDIIEPLVVGPPGPDGKRFIWAGERRWRAVGQLLAKTDALFEDNPDGEIGLTRSLLMLLGLPCVERDADTADALFIAVVENSQREDLTPWEDAQGLLALQAAKGWSARQLAINIGRAGADGESGVRDVQVKIKIAREATPDAIAAYLADGSWDRLRDSVSRPAAQDPNDRRAIDPAAAEASIPAAAVEPALPLEAPGQAAESTKLSDRDEFVLLELAHRTRANSKEEADWVTVGSYWLDATPARLQTLRLIAFRHAETPMATITDQGQDWLNAQGHALPVTVDALRQAHVRRFGHPPALGASIYATAWIDPVAVALEQSAAEDATGAADEPAQADIEDDPQVIEDRATHAQVDALFDAYADSGVVGGVDLGIVLQRLGLTFPLRTGVDSDSGLVMDGNGEPILVVDVNRENTDERAQAIAKLVVLAMTYLTADVTPWRVGPIENSSATATPPQPDADDAQEADEDIPGFLRRLAGAD
jgi:ParB-like chromosome segregation protein Spo0J